MTDCKISGFFTPRLGCWEKAIKGRVQSVVDVIASLVDCGDRKQTILFHLQKHKTEDTPDRSNCKRQHVPYPTRGNYVTRPSLFNTDQRLITLFIPCQQNLQLLHIDSVCVFARWSQERRRGSSTGNWFGAFEGKYALRRSIRLSSASHVVQLRAARKLISVILPSQTSPVPTNRQSESTIFYVSPLYSCF